MATDQPFDMIDWEFAARVGTTLTGEGPRVTAADASAAVAELRADAEKSTAYVRGFTGLEAPEDSAPVLVVDRAGWVRANVDTFATMIAPAIEAVMKDRTPPPAFAQAIGAKVTGVEVGGLLGYLSSKVLGQFDPFHGEAGRLLLVAPNIVSVERELSVDPTDFRLWVCLHEETHRVQFTSSPWLRDHLLAQVSSLASSMDVNSLVDRVTDLVKGGNRGSLVEAMTSPEQREILDSVTGVMSLLEGHADVVMDGVGPTVIPTVAEIRRAFDQRRKGVGVLDRVVRRLLGLEAKMAQYRDGAGFVRHVIGRIGMADFNVVWSNPDTLPSKAEIHDPDAWVARVHG